jgi:sulfoxide reductase heme-binding subunit YedZ
VRHLNSLLRRLPVWTVYLSAAGYAFWQVWLGATGGLGAEPIKALEHQLGEAALTLLLVGLAVTPLRRWPGLNLMRFRRAIGVSTFGFVCLHLAVWLGLDLQSPALIWADIVKRPYITVGMAGFILLLPLALTSNNWSLRRLGPVAWRRLHRLVYPAAILGVGHFVLLVKGFPVEPLVYATILAVLLGTRLWLSRQSTPRRPGRPIPPV